MKCKNCGSDLPESAKFCLECGAKVERNLICPSCGEILPPYAKFCLECGASVITITDKDKDDIKLTDGFAKKESRNNETDFDDEEMDRDAAPDLGEDDEKRNRIVQAYIDDHSELKWISYRSGMRFFYAISTVDGNEILQKYTLLYDEKTVTTIQAKNFQLFRIEQDGQAEVRILAEFEDEISLFDYDGNMLMTKYRYSPNGDDHKSQSVHCGNLQGAYYEWNEKQREENHAILLNLITGTDIRLKYENSYKWGFFVKNGKDIISYINYKQDGKRTGSLMWDDGSAGFKIIPVKEWEQLGGFPKANSRPEQLEANGYFKPSVMAYKIPWNLYQGLPELQKNSSVNTEEEVRQFIRNYLQIMGYIKLKDLGDGYYYLHHYNNGESPFWPNYAILNLNAIGDFMEKDEDGFHQLCCDLSNEVATANYLSRGNVVIWCHDAYDWISKPVDGKMYCLTPYESFGNEKYKLHIFDMHTTDSDGRKKETTDVNVEIRAYTSGEERVLITSHEEAFFIFDLDGNLILKKEGNYSMPRSCFGYQLLYDNNNFRCTGLYDEITGKEILPCQYQDFDVWKKKEGRNKEDKNREIFLQGRLYIDEGSGNPPSFRMDSLRYYDPQTGEVTVLTNTTSLLYYGMRSEEYEKLGYENIFLSSVNTDVSKPITLDSLDPEVAEQRRKNRR